MGSEGDMGSVDPFLELVRPQESRDQHRRGSVQWARHSLSASNKFMRKGRVIFLVSRGEGLLPLWARERGGVPDTCQRPSPGTQRSARCAQELGSRRRRRLVKA